MSSNVPVAKCCLDLRSVLTNKRNMVNRMKRDELPKREGLESIEEGEILSTTEDSNTSQDTTVFCNDNNNTIVSSADERVIKKRSWRKIVPRTDTLESGEIRSDDDSPCHHLSGFLHSPINPEMYSSYMNTTIDTTMDQTNCTVIAADSDSNRNEITSMHRKRKRSLGDIGIEFTPKHLKLQQDYTHDDTISPIDFMPRSVDYVKTSTADSVETPVICSKFDWSVSTEKICNSTPVAKSHAKHRNVIRRSMFGKHENADKGFDNFTYKQEQEFQNDNDKIRTEQNVSQIDISIFAKESTSNKEYFKDKHENYDTISDKPSISSDKRGRFKDVEANVTTAQVIEVEDMTEDILGLEENDSDKIEDVENDKTIVAEETVFVKSDQAIQIQDHSAKGDTAKDKLESTSSGGPDCTLVKSLTEDKVLTKNNIMQTKVTEIKPNDIQNAGRNTMVAQEVESKIELQKIDTKQGSTHKTELQKSDIKQDNKQKTEVQKSDIKQDNKHKTEVQKSDIKQDIKQKSEGEKRDIKQDIKHYREGQKSDARQYIKHMIDLKRDIKHQSERRKSDTITDMKHQSERRKSDTITDMKHQSERQKSDTITDMKHQSERRKSDTITDMKHQSERRKSDTITDMKHQSERQKSDTITDMKHQSERRKSDTITDMKHQSERRKSDTITDIKHQSERRKSDTITDMKHQSERRKSDTITDMKHQSERRKSDTITNMKHQSERRKSDTITDMKHQSERQKSDTITDMKHQSERQKSDTITDMKHQSKRRKSDKIPVQDIKHKSDGQKRDTKQDSKGKTSDFIKTDSRAVLGKSTHASQDRLANIDQLMSLISKQWGSSRIPPEDKNLTIATTFRLNNIKKGLGNLPGLLEGEKLCCINLHETEADANNNAVNNVVNNKANLQTIQQTQGRLLEQQNGLDQMKLYKLKKIEKKHLWLQEEGERKWDRDFRKLHDMQGREIHEVMRKYPSQSIFKEHHLSKLSQEHVDQRNHLEHMKRKDRDRQVTNLNASMHEEEKRHAEQLAPIQHLLTELEMAKQGTGKLVKYGPMVNVTMRKAPCKASYGRVTSVDVCMPAAVAQAVTHEDLIMDHFYAY